MLYLRKTFSFEHEIKDADVALVGVPFDSTETGFPVRFGPLFIREAIRNLPGWDKKKGNIFEKFKFADLGDIEVVPGSWKLTEERIKDTVEWIFSENKKALPVFLGGDHLITLGILNSIAKDRKVTVIHFDAHRDLMPDWMGEPYSHITWAYHALKNKNIKIVQVGCRSENKEESSMAKKVGSLKAKISGPVYLSVDLDVFDPSVAPEVGTPEPSGITFGDFLAMLDKIDARNIIGMDIVECASQRVNTQTALTGANVFKEVMKRRI